MAAALAGLRERHREEGEILQTRAGTLREVRESLQRADAKRTALQTGKDRAAEALAAAEQSLAAARAELRTLAGQVDFQTEAEAEKALREAALENDAAQAALFRAKKDAGEAKAAKENAQALRRRFTQELPDQSHDQEAREKAYAEILAEKGLSEAEWTEITAAYGRQDVPGYQARIDAHRKKRDSARGTLAAALASIAGRPRPDPDRLREAQDAAQARLDAAQEKLRRLQEDYRVNLEVYRALAPKMEERSQAAAAFARVDSLYERLSGRRSGARMDIETYVQRYYLDRILYAANRRFQDMSAGQFELRMVKAERAGEGKNRGLDLMVYSTVTGKEREVRTLSGGESFMAALSLALGMADQIQESSAAVHLDMMFIDEGFGSLDEHARNQAVRVLQHMAGGSRLIGIISHVSELKQEIEDQLVVEKDEEGSHVHWQIS